MKFSDLPSFQPDRPQLQLRCSACRDGPYSASKDDYFMAPPQDEVVCTHCGAPMELGRTVTSWEKVGK